MRTKLRSKITLLFVVCAVLIVVPAVAAFADLVKNDVVVNGTDTIAAGGTTTINYRIENNNAGGNDFKECDAADGSPVTVTIVKPAGVTASPGSLQFNLCESPQGVQFSAANAGNYPISVTTSDTRGNYNVGAAAFTLHVTPPPPPTNTPPTLSLPTNPTAEATAPNGAAVSFTATANDTQDGPLTPTCTPASGSTFPVGSTQVSCSATDSGNLTTSGIFPVTVVDTTPPTLTLPADKNVNATGPGGAVVTYVASASDIVDSAITPICTPASGSTFALGTTTVVCSATDAYGNSASGSFQVTVSDATPPVITSDVQGTLGDYGWYTSDVHLTWSVTDPESPNSIVKTGCVDQNITADQAATDYKCSATSAGGSAAEQTVTIKRDATEPEVTLGAASGTAGSNDWYTSAVTQTFNASDATSGLADPSQSSFPQSSGANEEGSNVSIGSGPVKDKAGNTNNGVNAGPFKIDLSDPVLHCDSPPSGWSANDVSIHCAPTDAISGLANPAADGDFNLSTIVPNGTETDSASTGNHPVADVAGRTVTAGPFTGLKVDKKDPTVKCGSADTAWHASNVSITCTASDGGSGLTDPADASFTLSTDVTAGTETANASTNSRTVSDVAGNSATGGPVAGNKVDKKAPTFESCPSGGPFLLNSGSGTPTTQSVGPIVANDGGSQVDSAHSTLSGSVNTSSTGTKSVTFTAKDNVGNSDTKTCTYDVNAYNFIGFSSPVDNPSYMNVLKAGQAIPLKWQLKDASGNPVTNLTSVTVTVKDLNCSTPTNIDLMEEVAAGASSLQNLGGGYYQFNWKSPTSYAKSCKVLTVNGVGVQQSAFFNFTK
jgi:hypothetical protein